MCFVFMSNVTSHTTSYLCTYVCTLYVHTYIYKDREMYAHTYVHMICSNKIKSDGVPPQQRGVTWVKLMHGWGERVQRRPSLKHSLHFQLFHCNNKC